MKTLFYLLNILLLSSITCAMTFAQGKIEKTSVKKGNIVFEKFKSENVTTFKKSGWDHFVPESFSDSYLEFPNNQREIESSFFERIFSKERAMELSNGRLICLISYNSIKEEIAYVEFFWTGEGDLPLTLEELDLLEKGFKSYPFKYGGEKKEKVNRFSIVTYPIVFNRLYK